MKNTLLFVLLALISGCAPLILGTGVTTLAIVVPQERSIGKIVDDNTIWIKLKKEYVTHSSLKKVSFLVNEGKILLTGNVHASLDRMLASKIAWDIYGVREVINEIEISEREESFTESAWITAQIKFTLLMRPNIRSVNYSIETHNGIVYLMGIAQSKDELKRVLDIVQRVDKVTKVVNYARMKGGDPKE